MPGLAVRPARDEELAELCRIRFAEPGPELVALFGSAARARRFGEIVFRHVGVTSPRLPTLAAVDRGRVCGLLQYRAGTEAPRHGAIEALAALRALGPLRLPAFLGKLRARARVAPVYPADAFVIAELTVDPAQRGRGVGGALLDAARAVAEARGFDRILLDTALDNPARRLYERKGYVAVASKRDEVYERLTGIPGRAQMELRLSGDGRPR